MNNTSETPFKCYQDAFGNWFISMKANNGTEVVMCQVASKASAEYLTSSLNQSKGNKE